MVTPATIITQRLKGSSYRRLAAELGFSAGHIHHVHKGIKEPGDELLTVLGLERVVTYRRVRNGTASQAAS